MSNLTHARLTSLVTYNPATGEFTRLSGKRAGHKTGSRIRSGYVHIYLDGKTYKAHRLAWFYVNGRWPDGDIDHINHNRSDNRIENLRVAVGVENHHNRRRITNSLTGFIGVAWHARDRRWQSTIEASGRATHLGYFKCLGQAIRARIDAEKIFHPSRPR